MKGQKPKELQVLKLINQNRDWREILSSPPYNLIIKEKITQNYYGDDSHYVLLKYNQLNSDMGNPIVQECRGLILKETNCILLANPPIEKYVVASMRFSKFFNHGEEKAAKLDFNEPVEVSEKIDGSLIGLWYDNNKWHVSTSGNIDAKDAELSLNKDIETFRDLFDIAWENAGFDNFDMLNKDYTYMFELVSPYNRIVVPYKNTELYLLAVRDNNTLQELNRKYIPEVFKGKIKTPRTFYCSNIEEIKEAVDNLTENDEHYEGFVVCDKDFNRIKLKSTEYMNLFFIRGEGVFSNKKILKLILDEQDDDILSHFPEYKDDFDKIRRGYALLISRYKKDLEFAKRLRYEDRKTFAESVKNLKTAHVIFAALTCGYWDMNEEEQFEWLKDRVTKQSLSVLLQKVEEEL